MSTELLPAIAIGKRLEKGRDGGKDVCSSFSTDSYFGAGSDLTTDLHFATGSCLTTASYGSDFFTRTIGSDFFTVCLKLECLSTTRPGRL